MLKDFFHKLCDFLKRVLSSRIFALALVFTGMFLVLAAKLFDLQIINGESYLEDYVQMIEKTVTTPGTRGNIYDRNGVLLAYNELAYSVTIQDNGDYDKKSEKNKALNQIVTKVINIVESNGDSVINDFGIILDANSEYSFVSESDTQRLRFIADVYGKKTIDELSDKQKSQSAADIMHYLCTDKTYGYGINEKKLDKTMILKLVNVRYAMSLNSYQKYISTTIASDVSDQTVADIMENSDSPRRIACLSVLNTTSLSGRYSFSLTFKFCSMLSTSSLPGVYSLHIPVLPVSVPLSSVPHVSLTVCLQISQIRSDHFRSS